MGQRGLLPPAGRARPGLHLPLPRAARPGLRLRQPGVDVDVRLHTGRALQRPQSDPRHRRRGVPGRDGRLRPRPSSDGAPRCARPPQGRQRHVDRAAAHTGLRRRPPHGRGGHRSRHLRAQAGGVGDGPPGPARRPHRASEPQPPARPSVPGVGPRRAPAPRRGRRLDDRPRPLQARERHARAPGRRRLVGRRRPASQRGAASGRHRRPAGRRRVRRDHRSGEQHDARSTARRAPRRTGRRHLSHRRHRGLHQRQHRRSARAGRRHQRGPAVRRRRRHVPGQGTRARTRRAVPPRSPHAGRDQAGRRERAASSRRTRGVRPRLSAGRRPRGRVCDRRRGPDPLAA